MDNLPPADHPTKPSSPLQGFRRVTPGVIVLLTLVTLGFYVPYWLYTRTRVLNQLLPASPIPSLLIALCMGGYLMLAVLVFQIPADLGAEKIIDSPEFSHLMNATMVLNFVQLFWAILFLQRINLCTQAKPGDALYGSYFLLVLVHFLIVNVYYLQYKLNQIMAQPPNPDNTPTGILRA